jgi:urea transporter
MMDLLIFVESVLKGVGQVMFMGSPITGAFFLVGIAVASWRVAIMAFLGSLIGTLAGLALAAPEEMIAFGLFGFNGVLCAQALGGVFTKFSKGNVVYALLTAGFSSVIFAALVKFLGPYGIPALTAPFVFATWFFLFAAKNFTAIPWREPGTLPSERINAIEFVKVVLKGVGQVMFMGHWISGLLFCIGLSLGTFHWQTYPYYLGGLVAFMGSLCGTVTALVLKAPNDQIRFGLFGFNSVLAALAVGGVFIALGLTSIVWAIAAAVIASVVMSALIVLLKPYGIPALTAPFVFTTWLFLFGLRLFAFPPV